MIHFEKFLGSFLFPEILRGKKLICDIEKSVIVWKWRYGEIGKMAKLAKREISPVWKIISVNP